MYTYVCKLGNIDIISQRCLSSHSKGNPLIYSYCKRECYSIHAPWIHKQTQCKHTGSPMGNSEICTSRMLLTTWVINLGSFSITNHNIMLRDVFHIHTKINTPCFRVCSVHGVHMIDNTTVFGYFHKDNFFFLSQNDWMLLLISPHAVGMMVCSGWYPCWKVEPYFINCYLNFFDASRGDALIRADVTFYLTQGTNIEFLLWI